MAGPHRRPKHALHQSLSGRSPHDGRRARRGLLPRLLTLVCVTCYPVVGVPARRGAESGLPTWTSLEARLARDVIPCLHEPAKASGAPASHPGSHAREPGWLRRRREVCRGLGLIGARRPAPAAPQVPGPAPGAR